MQSWQDLLELQKDDEMRNLKELNINEGGKPVSRRAPTKQAILDFETEFEISLPLDYVEFLNFSNGGHPELNSFSLSGDGDYRGSIDVFYHLDDDFKDCNNLWWVTKSWIKTLGGGVISVGGDGGGIK